MKNTIYALGFFDGVHLGHQALLEACRKLADQHGCSAGVVTFAAHPDTLVKGNTPRLINSPKDREQLLRNKGQMEILVTLPFDFAMRTMPWEKFLDMLRNHYDAAGFVCGEDFRFGHRGSGTADALREYCNRENLPCTIVPDQILDGVRISSTYIRAQLEDGHMATAVKFLGHPHVLSGTVVHGQALGRKLGFPTANLLLPDGLAIPKFGVYACSCLIDGKRYPAVTNLGTRPTVQGSGITVEAWILDYSGNLYDQEIMLEFHYFLRPEQKFPTLEDLKQEIFRNAEETRDYLHRLFTA